MHADNLKVGKLILCRNFAQTQHRFLHEKRLLVLYMYANFLKYFWMKLINWEWKGNLNGPKTLESFSTHDMIRYCRVLYLRFRFIETGAVN